MEETIPIGKVKIVDKKIGKSRVSVKAIAICIKDQILKVWTEKELIKEILKINALERIAKHLGIIQTRGELSGPYAKIIINEKEYEELRVIAYLVSLAVVTDKFVAGAEIFGTKKTEAFKAIVGFLRRIYYDKQLEEVYNEIRKLYKERKEIPVDYILLFADDEKLEDLLLSLVIIYTHTRWGVKSEKTREIIVREINNAKKILEEIKAEVLSKLQNE
jgi:hypothetical protein